MNALRNIHAVLAPAAVLVDTQPTSPHPRVTSQGAVLGTLDMRKWRSTIRAVDERILEAVGAGLFEMQHEERLAVTDRFDNGPECLETVGNWRETRIPSMIRSRLDRREATVEVEQEVRLRLYRRVTQSLN